MVRVIKEMSQMKQNQITLNQKGSAKSNVKMMDHAKVFLMTQIENIAAY